MESLSFTSIGTAEFQPWNPWNNSTTWIPLPLVGSNTAPNVTIDNPIATPDPVITIGLPLPIWDIDFGKVIMPLTLPVEAPREKKKFRRLIRPIKE